MPAPTADADKTSAALQEQLFRAACWHASRLGLSRDEAEDCASEFVLKMLRIELPNPVPAPWLHRCAANHASNWVRSLSRRRNHEASLTDRFGEQADLIAQAVAAEGPGPRTLFLRRELWQQLVTALKQLTPAQQEIVVRFHLRGQSVRHIADRTGRTSHAIEQSLSNARKRLAALLLQGGWSADDARQLFRSVGPPAAPAQKNSFRAA